MACTLLPTESVTLYIISKVPTLVVSPISLYTTLEVRSPSSLSVADTPTIGLNSSPLVIVVVEGTFSIGMSFLTSSLPVTVTVCFAISSWPLEFVTVYVTM